MYSFDIAHLLMQVTVPSVKAWNVPWRSLVKRVNMVSYGPVIRSKS